MSGKRLVPLLAALAALALALPAGASAFGPLSSFGSTGEAAGELWGTEGIAVGPDGSVYVADFPNYRVSVYGADGAFRFAFGRGVNATDGSDVCTAASGCDAGEPSGAAGALSGLEGIAFGAGGNLYLADYSNNRVSVFTPQGQFLYAFGKSVAVSSPGDVCTPLTGCQMGEQNGAAGALYNPRGIAVAPSGDVYVSGGFNNRIDVFSAQGQFLFAFGKDVAPGPPEADVCTAATTCQQGYNTLPVSGAINPDDLVVAPDGRVFVSDGFRRVSVFSATGAFQFAFGRGVDVPSGGDVCTTECGEGSASGLAGAIRNPHGIAIAPAAVGGHLFVSDGINNRVSEFGPDGGFVKAFGEGVRTGAAVFETCTAASGCQEGLETTDPGSIALPTGIAVDCNGAVFVGEYDEGVSADSVRVERFGEPGTPLPSSCGVPSGPSPLEPVAKPSNRFKFGKLKLNRRKGTATLLVSVPGAGKLVLRGKGLKKATRAARRAGTVKLPLKPVGKARRKLLATGKAKLKAKVTFTPSGGSPLTRTRSLTLKKTVR